MKWYGVQVGKSGEPKVLDNWKDCQSEVIGVRGAIYKSFKKKEDATEYAFKKVNKVEVNVNKGYVCYVDGSFNSTTGVYGYGLVVLKDGEVVQRIKGSGDDETLKEYRNVTGEVLGALSAFRFAIKNSIREITVVYDYLGVEHWATGDWGRDCNLSKDYYKFCQNVFKSVKVNFVKVKGHSGDKYNDLVDNLAKQATGVI